MEQTNGARPEMEAPFAPHPRCSAAKQVLSAAGGEFGRVTIWPRTRMTFEKSLDLPAWGSAA